MSELAARPGDAGAPEAARIPAAALGRLLEPRSVAVVGASDNTGGRGAIPALLASGLDVFLVNPRRPAVHGVATYPDLAAIGEPVDAVLSMVNGRLAVDVVGQAASLGVGGVVVYALGFAESGAEGEELQGELVAAAGGRVAILGPNCNGFINPHSGAFLSAAPRLRLRAGGVGVVSHSGAFLTDIAHAGWERQIGFSKLISSGNEAQTDMVDYVEWLIDDPSTRVICLAMESIRRPAAFLDALERARLRGKPIVALKLGRSERGRSLAQSHTGAIAGESWAYDAVFEQFGVIGARDISDLIDRAVLFDQLPPERWSAVDGLAVLCVSGGAAELASDVAEDERLALRRLDDLVPAIQEHIPSATTVNPLDLVARSGVKRILDVYAASPEVDALLMLWMLDEDSETFGAGIVGPCVELAQETAKPIVLASVEESALGRWATELPRRKVAVARGVRPVLRGLEGMRRFMAARARPPRPAGPVTSVARPLAAPIATPAGPMLPFAAAMEQLSAAGIPVAPFAVIEAGDTLPAGGLGFDGPYVVKLADVPHRTDVGAVRLGVPAAELAGAVAGLRALAAAEGLPATVAIQPQLPSDGEVFVGVQAAGELGPMVLCGLGGIFVEVLRRAGGAVAPFGRAEAEHALEAFADVGVFEGLRGGRPWDRAQLAGIMVAMSDVALAAGGWLDSIDVNPLLLGPDGFVAVDGLFLLREE